MIKTFCFCFFPQPVDQTVCSRDWRTNGVWRSHQPLCNIDPRPHYSVRHWSRHSVSSLCPRYSCCCRHVTLLTSFTRRLNSCAYAQQRSVWRDIKLYFLGLKLMNCLSNIQKITTQRVKFAHQIWSGLVCCWFDVSSWMVAGCLAPDLFWILSSSPESETCPVW